MFHLLNHVFYIMMNFNSNYQNDVTHAANIYFFY